MAYEVATAWVTLAVSADGARRKIQRELEGIDGRPAGRRVGEQLSSGAVANTNLSAFERKLVSAAQSAGSKASKVLETSLKAGAATGAAAFATTAKLGADRLLAIDDARGKLSGLGHDAAAQAKIMDSALASVKGTAYGLGDAATVSAAAVAAGIKPGQDLTKYLKSAADAATIAGSSLGEMGSIFNKVQTGQTAMTDDLNMLADRGVPIYQWVAKEMGISAAEVKKFAEKGKIDSATFFKAINENIAGAALESGKTVRGSFNNMKAAVGRLGAAIDEPSFKRAPATFAAITKAIDDATPAAGRMAQQFDAKVFDDWVPKAKNAWQTLAANPAVQSNLAEVGQLLGSLGATAGDLWPSLVQIASSLGQASGTLGVSTWQLFVTTLEAAAGVANLLVGPLQTVAELMRDHQGLVTAGVAAWLAFRTVPALLDRVGGGANTATTAAFRMFSTLSGGAGARASLSAIAGDYRNVGAAAQNSGQHVSQWTRSMSALSNNSATVRNMANAFAGAETRVGAFGSALSAGAAPGMAKLRSGAQGVISTLGGPWGAAFAGAGIAAGLIIAKNQRSAQSFDALQASIKSSAEAQAELDAALMKSRGAYDENVASSASDRISEMKQRLQAAASREGSPLDTIRAEGEGVFSFKSMFGGYERTQAEAIKAQADEAKAAQTALSELGLTQQELADKTYGGSAAFGQMVRQLESTGDGGKKAAGDLRSVREDFLKTQEAAQRTTPGISEMSKAMQVLGDKTSSTADRTKALTAAIDALNPARSKGAAIAEHDKVLRQIAESTQEAIDKTKGFGQELLSAEFGVNTATANGEALRDKLTSLADASITAAAAGRPLAEIHANNATQLQGLATQYGVTIEQMNAAFAKFGGGRDLELTAKLSGAPEAIQQIGQIGRAMQDAKIGEKKYIPIAVDDKAKAALESLKFTVEQIPGGKGVNITANTAEAQAQLQNITNILAAQIPSNKPINLSAPGGQAVYDLLRSMGVQLDKNKNGDINVTAPLAPAVLEQLKALGIQIDRNKDGTISVKQVGAEAVKAQIDEAARDRTVTINYRTGQISDPSGRGTIGMQANGGIVPMASGGFRFLSRKPRDANIYAGRGAGTLFAEEETGGESYIPLALAKRARSEQILRETARLFGLQLIRPSDVFNRFADGGITVDQLKQYAQGIEGKNYTWGGAPGAWLTDCSGAQSQMRNFITGASGRFATGSQGGELAKSGFINGDPPPGQAAYWIGWKNGGPGGGHTAGTIVDPTGGNVNVEMGGARGNGQYGGGAAGAAEFPNRAWISLQGQGGTSGGGSARDDLFGSSSGSGSAGGSSGGSSFRSATSAELATAGKKTTAAQDKVKQAEQSVSDKEFAVEQAKRKLSELDGKKVSESQRLAAQRKVEVAERELTDSKDRLTKAQNSLTEAQDSEKKLRTEGVEDAKKAQSAGNDQGSQGQSFAQGMFSGVLQSLGLDGSVFSNPLEWPNVKSLTAGANWLGGLLKGSQTDDSPSSFGQGALDGVMSGAGLNLPQISDYLKPIEPQKPITRGPGDGLPLQGGNTNIDQSVHIQNAGANARDVMDKVASKQNAAFRRQGVIH